MNLQKLFEMQRQLDEYIMDEHPELRGQDNLPWKVLALQVELGECANEWRGFKKWSHDQEPRIVEYCSACGGSGVVEYFDPFGEYGHAQDECMYCEGSGTTGRMPLLEEYVDCLHFILSIGNEFGYKAEPTLAIAPDNVLDQFLELFKIVSYMHNIYKDLGYGCGVHDFYDDLLANFMNLGRLLGFTGEQIEEAYMQKNKVNHARQESGY